MLWKYLESSELQFILYVNTSKIIIFLVQKISKININIKYLIIYKQQFLDYIGIFRGL